MYYLIIGEGLGRLPITNIHLKTIEFYQTSPIQPFPLEEESSDLFERDCFYYKPGLKLCG
ncbi:hypothetical protein Bca52824_086739 [Brassica carinata]|uniref:Uncharacterized protein n=1 Tax=Brassica carinata TaxID=52824 RepID=A0A8X7TMY8_BRACI|nr:hypothetical protein Bca52824_086739 [Brassica carinata]